VRKTRRRRAWPVSLPDRLLRSGLCEFGFAHVLDTPAQREASHEEILDRIAGRPHLPTGYTPIPIGRNPIGTGYYPVPDWAGATFN
jgi:hypothetical protein